MKDLNVYDNTLTVFMSDHGYSLGEANSFRKENTNFLVTRVPLIITTPWLTSSSAKVSHSMFELIDLMPTIAALTGIEINESIDGIDQSSLMLNPDMSLKHVSFTEVYRDDHITFPGTKFVGFVLKTKYHRFTKWYILSDSTVLWNNDTGFEELYVTSDMCKMGVYDDCDTENVVHTEHLLAENFRMRIQQQFRYNITCSPACQNVENSVCLGECLGCDSCLLYAARTFPPSSPPLP
jgi:arylsulfatase A-like enzyme